MRLFTGKRYGRPITDWKHTDVPPGTEPHRPVLGRPVDVETLERSIRKPKALEVTPKTKEPPAMPLVPLRTAHQGEIPSSCMTMHVLGGEYGWEAGRRGGAISYCQTAVGDEIVVLALRRRDLGAVGVWERREGRDGWKFTDGFTRCGALTERVGSEQLKSWLRQRDERCPDCGRSSAAHPEGECP